MRDALPRDTARPPLAGTRMRRETLSGWSWVPSLYFAQGLPYVAVTALSVILYKNLELSNAEVALYTSWLYLPWVIKPLWSPLVDQIRTKRTWIVAMQAAIAVACGLLALALSAPHFLLWTLALFWVIAICSATHDIAADGYYMLAHSTHAQAAFVGIRSVFFRVALITGQGALVYLAGSLVERSWSVIAAWQAAFALLAVLFALLVGWHRAMLPIPDADRPAPVEHGRGAAFVETFAAFFRRADIGIVLAFLLTFRLGEAQALKLVAPFLLDPRAAGGLGLPTADVGLVYGTIGVLALTAGGVAGGYAISRHGLARWLWPMLLAIHLPNLAFVWLACVQPTELALITAAIAVEQFGYGFGFAGYLLYMILVADGDGSNPNRTAHYAICAGIMGLGMMLPGMASGWLQEQLGYRHFFAWVCLATLPSLVAATFLRIDPAFGRKRADG
jgi:PAT family beta-lactamase induction signal transducer AmpG